MPGYLRYGVANHPDYTAIAFTASTGLDRVSFPSRTD